MITIEVKPTEEIKKRLKLQKGGPVEKFATQTCATHMDKYVPFDEGTLAKYYIIDNKIYYDQPYAHYMYEGIVYVDPIYKFSAMPIKDKDGNLKGFFSRKGVTKIPSSRLINYNKSGHTYAGPHWAERMWSAEKNEVVEEIENFMRR